MPLKILICGGGMAGLSAAGFLRSAGGSHDLTVLERGPEPAAAPQATPAPSSSEAAARPKQHLQSQPQPGKKHHQEDYGLSIVANAFNLLQKAGAVDADEDDVDDDLDMAIMTHLWMRDHANRETATMHFDTRSKYGGSPSVLVRRSRLRGALLRFATGTTGTGTGTTLTTTSETEEKEEKDKGEMKRVRGPPAKIVYNAKVSRVDVETGSVETADGRSFAGYDLVIGADGINSVVRDAVLASLFPPSPSTSPSPSLSPSPSPSPPSVVHTHDLLAFMTSMPVAELPAPEFGFLKESSDAVPTPKAGLTSFSDITGDQGPRKRRILAYHSSPRDLQVIGYAPMPVAGGQLAAEFSSASDTSPSSVSSSVETNREESSPTTTTTPLTAILRYVDVETHVLPLFRGAFSDPVVDLLCHGRHHHHHQPNRTTPGTVVTGDNISKNRAVCDAWRLRDVTSRSRLLSSNPDTKSSTQQQQNPHHQQKDWWRAHRALLIGDAAHAVVPHAGQGCNMAIEDAEALGFLLRDFGSSDGEKRGEGEKGEEETEMGSKGTKEKQKEDLYAIIDRYIALRRPRTTLVARRSRELAALPVEFDDDCDDDDDDEYPPTEDDGGKAVNEEVEGTGAAGVNHKNKKMATERQPVSSQEFAKIIHSYQGLEAYIETLG